MCPKCRTLAQPAKGRSGKHPLFNIWKGIIQRCENPNHDAFRWYGGKGVSLYPEWRSDFDAFAQAVGERPSMAHTLDRIDGSGDYAPGNVRWATAKEQQSNRTGNVHVEWQGETLTISQAAERSAVDRATFAWRIANGWSIEEAMTIPSMMTALRGVSKHTQ